MAALAESRWPATTPDKECQCDLARAQQEERAAGKALGDAKAAAAKARVVLDDAEAAEVAAGTAFENTQAKTAEVAAKFSALKGAETSSGDSVMVPAAFTLSLETELGRVRKLVASKEAKVRGYAAQREL